MYTIPPHHHTTLTLHLLILCCEDDPTTYSTYHSPSSTVGPIIENLQRGINASLSPSSSSATLSLFDCKNDYAKLPSLDLVSYDGVIIPGSLSDAHDTTTPWINALRTCIKTSLHPSKIPTIGICFGHQIIASALGGTTGPLASGGRVGACRVAPKNWNLVCSHNDGVTELPACAKEVKTDEDFCVLANYGDEDGGGRVWAVTIQAHPEYDEAQLNNCARCFLKGDERLVAEAMEAVDWKAVDFSSRAFWDETLQLLFPK